VTSSDAQVQIGASQVGVPPVSGAVRLAVSVRPNPVTSAAELAVEADRAAPLAVRIVDLRGAVIRRFDVDAGAPGPRTLRWDGRDAAGRRAPPGLYVVTVTQSGRTATRRMLVVR
jgi:flagellar hook assembly protein FlgD